MTTASNAAAEREMVVLHRYMGMLNGKEIGWSVWVECDHVNGDVYEPGSYEHATFRRVEGEGEKPAPDKPCAQFMETGLFCRVPFAEHGKEDHVFIWHDGPVSPKRPAPPPASGTEKVNPTFGYYTDGNLCDHTGEWCAHPDHDEVMNFDKKPPDRIMLAPPSPQTEKRCLHCGKEITGAWDSYQGDGFGRLLHVACRPPSPQTGKGEKDSK